MTGEIMKIVKKNAFSGGTFYYVFFKIIETGKSARSCIYKRMRNFAKWEDIIKGNKIGLRLSNLIMLKKNVVNADSEFVVIKADVPKVDPVPERPPKAIGEANFCAICGKLVKTDVLCRLAVNIGNTKDEDGETHTTKDIDLIIHSACRDELYKKIGTGTEAERDRIDRDLIQKAKAKAGL